MLISASNRLAQSARLRRLLFAVAALLTILLIGYHYGTFDQTIHIPFLKKYADPSLYPGNEEFFNLRFQHYSYFWFLFLPFYRWGVLEPVLFVGHFLATYLTFWAFWNLTETLFHDPLANLIAAMTFIVPHIGFSGFPIFEWSLLNRTAMLPFLLWAMTLFLQRKYVCAFALLGVVFNFHVLSAAYVLCFFMLDVVLEFKKMGWRAVLLGFAAFFVAALPLLVWRALSSTLRFAPDLDWFTIVSNGMFFHLFYLIAPYPHILLVTVAGVSALALFIIAWRARLAPEHDRTMAIFVMAALIIIAVQEVATYTKPLTIIIQSQIMRAGLLALILSYVYFAGYLAARYRSGAVRGADFGLLLAAFMSGVLPFLPALVWLLQRWVASPWWRRLAAGLSVAAMFVAALLVAPIYHLWSPGIYVFMRPTPWHEAQAWAKSNTPPDAVFITPLQQWWFYDADWRVFSERAQVVSYSDLLEIALVPDYLNEWRTRFEQLAPGVMAQFDGDVFANRQRAAAAYNSLSDAELLRVAREYHAAYVVMEKPHLRPWPVAHENAQFVIYQVPQNDAFP